MPLPYLDFGLLFVGLLLLIKTSELAVNALLRIAEDFGLTEFTTSFLIVGIAAVLPELFLGLAAAFEGEPGFGLGVIFGSNIVDLTLVLGIIALYSGGIRIESKNIQGNLLFLFLAALPVLLALDGEIGRIDGLVLLFAFAFYVYRISQERKSFSKTLERIRNHKADFLDNLVIAVFSIAVLFASAYLVSTAAVNISSALVLPILLVGMVISFGTCLPELSFSLQSVRDKHPELGLGDIIGNVITDCTATLGLIALVHPIRVADASALVMGVFMIGSVVLSVYFMRSGTTLSKREGIILVLGYIAVLVAQLYFAIG